MAATFDIIFWTGLLAFVWYCVQKIKINSL